MNWTNVPKPTGTTYTNVTFSGKIAYDDASVLYDDPSVFYDGVNYGAWTNVAKPAELVITAGVASGLLMPLTNRSKNSVSEDPWTYVPKPS